MPNNLTKRPPAHRLIRDYLAAHRKWGQEHRRNQLLVLNRLHDWLAAQGLELVTASRGDLDSYMDERISSGLKSSSANREWLYLRNFYRWAVDNGDVEAGRESDYGPMQKVAAPAVDEPDPDRQQACSAEDYELLMRSWDKRKLVDCRNAAMCSLMYRTGLRSIEVSRIDVDRLDLSGEVPTVEVLGKGKNGGKWRKVPLMAETVAAIERYIRRLGDDAPDEGALFLSTWSGSLTGVGRMNERAIRDTIEKRARKVGLPELRVHQLRRACATEARERGIADQTIIDVLGWADGRMLATYTRQRKQAIAIAAFAAADPTAVPAAAIRRGGRGRLRAVS